MYKNFKSICNITFALVMIGLYNTSHAECGIFMQMNQAVTDTQLINEQQLDFKQTVNNNQTSLDCNVVQNGCFTYEAKTDEEKAKIAAENRRRQLEEQKRIKYENDVFQKIINNDKFMKDCTKFVNDNFKKLFGNLEASSRTVSNNIIGSISFNEKVKQHQLEELLIIGVQNRFKVFASIIANCAKAREKGWTLAEDDKNRVGVIKLNDKSSIQLSWDINNGDFTFNIEKMVTSK